MKPQKKKVTFILGSGFSCEADLPSTRKLSEQFLLPQDDSSDLDKAISRILTEFWRDQFGFHNGGPRPTLEDHFTVLDLSANTGHCLGKNYTPKKLRAIRRISIHRIFSILNKAKGDVPTIDDFLNFAHEKFKSSFVTLNWDIILENHLQEYDIPFHYPRELIPYSNLHETSSGIPVIKMHGSSNWVYCDCCRRLIYGLGKKIALEKKCYLEKEDFELFGEIPSDLGSDDNRNNNRKCPKCHHLLAGRLATFSFRKFFGIPQFQSIWEQGYSLLRDADAWVFIGYSLPSADFEFLHLLKSAQMARQPNETMPIHAVVASDADAETRYQQFFGTRNVCVHRDELGSWNYNDSLKDLFP